MTVNPSEIWDLSDGIIFLSPFVSADAPVLSNGDNDAEHRRRFELPAEFIPSLGHSQEVIARWTAERAAGTRFALAVRDATSNELLGGVEVQPREAYIGNLSYWTYPAHRGRGIATRAVALACRFAFEDLGLQRLEILADSDNQHSRHVAGRNGFAESGVREGRIVHVRVRTASRAGAQLS